MLESKVKEYDVLFRKNEFGKNELFFVFFDDIKKQMCVLNENFDTYPLSFLSDSEVDYLTNSEEINEACKSLDSFKSFCSKMSEKMISFASKN